MKIKNLFLTVGTMMVMALATTGCGGKKVSLDLPGHKNYSYTYETTAVQEETTPAPTEAVVEETTAFVPKASTYDSYEKALIAEGWADVVPYVIDDVEFLQFDEIATAKDGVPYETWDLDSTYCKDIALANYINYYCDENNFNINTLTPSFDFSSRVYKVSVDLPDGTVLKLLQFLDGEKLHVVAAVVNQ